jgi:serine/threonine protein kinase
MAPEFIDSNPENRAITKKCDLYSLGVIIMELLTGTRKQCAVNDVRVTFLFLIYSYIYMKKIQISTT